MRSRLRTYAHRGTITFEAFSCASNGGIFHFTNILSPTNDQRLSVTNSKHERRPFDGTNSQEPGA